MLSISRAKTILSCPRKYKLRYIDKVLSESKFSFVRGKWIHYIIQLMH